MKVKKTIKLFIGGKFPRSESGLTLQERFKDSDEVYSEVCKASRKDLRGAVEAAKKGHLDWSACTPYLRSQILYRMAEMTEGKRSEFQELFADVLGLNKKQAEKAVQEGIDAFVYYAGFADKYQQIIGTVNPVASPHHNFTNPESVGVCLLVAQDRFDFGKLIADISSILCAGNSLIVLLGKECRSVLAPLAEIFATSDLPAGAVNLLTGELNELKKWIGSHMEIQAISFQNEDLKVLGEMRELGIQNLKRISPPSQERESAERILSFVEYKTIWHPIGI